METKAWDVLITDDEIDVLLLTGDFLRRKGLTVLTAQDSGYALKQLDENEVKLVVLDVNLGGEDGIELMSFLKRNHPNTHIILYTGLSHNDKQVKEMLAAGATCYVNKGTKLDDLLYAIREVRGENKKPK